MRTCASLALCCLLAACRTPEPAAAVTTPAPASLPALEAMPGPAASGSLDDDIVYDHRGAFGPLRVEQLAVDLDTATLRCLRLPVRGEAQQASAALDEAQVAFLRAQRDALLASPPADAPRGALVHDLGVITLTLRGQGQERALVVDGAKTLAPYPDALLARLVELKPRCAPSPSDATPPAP